MLFGIVFLWQLPHFHALSWLYRDDYARAGPAARRHRRSPTAGAPAAHAAAYAAALVPMSLAPAFVGLAGPGHPPRGRGPARGVARRARRAVSPAARRPPGPGAVRRLARLSAVALDLARLRARLLMPEATDLPAVNATLNGISAVLLATGYVFIRRRRIDAPPAVHAGGVRDVDPVPGLVPRLPLQRRVGPVHPPGADSHRLLHDVLLSHIVLAAIILPLALVTLQRALRGRFTRHAGHRPLDPPHLALRLGNRDRRLLDAVPHGLAPPNPSQGSVFGPSPHRPRSLRRGTPLRCFLRRKLLGRQLREESSRSETPQRARQGARRLYTARRRAASRAADRQGGIDMALLAPRRSGRRRRDARHGRSSRASAGAQTGYVNGIVRDPGGDGIEDALVVAFSAAVANAGRRRPPTARVASRSSASSAGQWLFLAQRAGYSPVQGLRARARLRPGAARPAGHGDRSAERPDADDGEARERARRRSAHAARRPPMRCSTSGTTIGPSTPTKRVARAGPAA